MSCHASMRNPVQIIPFFTRNRNIKEIHRPAAAVTDRKGGTENICTVNLQEEVQEAFSHIMRAFPYFIRYLLQRKFRTEAIYYNPGGIRSLNPDKHLPVRKIFISDITVSFRFSVIRIKGQSGVKRPLFFHIILPLLPKCSVSRCGNLIPSRFRARCRSQSISAGTDIL